MPARAALNRASIAESFSTRSPLTVVEAYRPPVEAIDDLDWLANESSHEMGEGSTFGSMLERASRERELVIVDDAYMHGKRPGFYGKSLSDQPWEEWVEDPSIVRTKHSPKRVKDGGYARPIWAARPKQSEASVAGHFGVEQIYATEMTRNLGRVRALLPTRTQSVLLTQHQPTLHSVSMRTVFGQVVRIAHLAKAAREGFRGSDVESLTTLPQWLENLASRIVAKKPKAGDTPRVTAVKKEMMRELKLAYEAFEQKRIKGLRYPYQDRERRARRLSLVGA